MDIFGKLVEKMMKSTMNIKEDFDKIKSELKNKKVYGTSGGGMVNVEANARFEIIQIDIEDDVLKNTDKKMLQELIRSAVNDALRKSESTALDELKNLSKSIDLPFDLSSMIK